MSKSMPPLNALRAFEAAARLGSFSRAAEELNVTPGALSHQIRGLEALLDLPLFKRQARGIALTTHGRTLYPGLQAGFGLLRDAVAGLRARTDKQILVLSTPPGFTAKWLAPRLYRFAELHPDIELRVASSVGYANFVSDGVDVAIRNATTPPSVSPALVYEKLLDGDMVPVCSPNLFKRLDPACPLHGMRDIPLIHDEQLAGEVEVPTWAEWFRIAGIDGGDTGRGLHFSSADHALDAALEGAGMLLTHAILAHDDLRSGRLIMPANISIPSRRAYYLTYPKSKQSVPGVQAFRQWLLNELGRNNI